jgi:RNA-directed DNA polymerase
MFAPHIRGWINYYGRFYKSVLAQSLRRIDFHLLSWARRKFKRLRQRPRGAREWLARVVRQSPMLFAHWPLLYRDRRTLEGCLPKPAKSNGFLWISHFAPAVIF